MAKRYILAVHNLIGQQLCTLFDSEIPQEGAAYNIEITKQLASGWKEVKFSLSKYDNHGERNWRWDYIRNENQLYLYEDGELEIFSIKAPTDLHDSNKVQYTVKANHIAEELKTRNLYGYFDDDNGIGKIQDLVNLALAKTGWTLTYCDTFLEKDGETEKVRSYSCDPKTGAYNMISGLCELFNARPVFHSDRTVEIYSNDNFDGYMEILFGKNSNSISRVQNSESLVTRLYVEGEYGDYGYVGIDDVNPTGLPFILNFDYYKELGLFTQAHQDAVDTYLEDYLDVVTTISGKQSEHNQENGELITLIGTCAWLRYPVVNGKPDKDSMIQGGTKPDDDTDITLHNGDKVAAVKSTGVYEHIEYDSSASSDYSAYAYLIKFYPVLLGKIATEEDMENAKQNNIDSLLESLNKFLWKNGYAQTRTEFASVAELKQAYGVSDLIIVDSDDFDVSGLPEGLQQTTTRDYAATIGKNEFDKDTFETQRYVDMADAVDHMTRVHALELEIEAAKEEQAIVENTFVAAMGPLLRDGYWSDTNYIPGLEQSLYNDALEISEKTAKPTATYTIATQDLSFLPEYEGEDFHVGQSVRVWDDELGINDYVVVTEQKIYPDKPKSNSITLKTDLLDIGTKTFATTIERITELANTLKQNKEKYERAQVIGRNGSVPVSVLEGAVDVLTNRLTSVSSNWTTDEKGNILLTSLDGTSAMMLCGGGFMVANSKNADGAWEWRTFGTGEGFTADMITTGYLSADRIQAYSITVDHLNSDVRTGLDLSSNHSIQLIVDDLEGDISTVEQTANKISWIISSGQSSASMTLTPEFLSATAANIDLSANQSITAIVDDLEGDITSVEQTANKITWIVSGGTSSATMTLSNDFKNAIMTTVTGDTGYSQVAQNAEKITWLVQGGTGASNMVLTDEFYNLTAQNINLNANSSYTSTVGNLAQGITSAQNTANSAASVASAAQSSIDNLTIGGRNILRGTGNITNMYGGSNAIWSKGQWYKTGDSSATVACGVTLPNPPIPGLTKGVQITSGHAYDGTSATHIGIAQGGVPFNKEMVTMSVWVKGTTGDKIYLQPLYSSNNEKPERNHGKEFTLQDDAWHKYTHSTTPAYEHPAGASNDSSGDGGFANGGYVYLRATAADHSIYITGIKMEYGNRATDWTPAPEDIDNAMSAIENDLQNQIDQKIETYYQDTDPSTSWTTAALRAAHEGDLWYYTGETETTSGTQAIIPNATYRYSGSATDGWTEFRASKELFDLVDGKTTIKYGTPSGTTSGNETGDYLVDSTDGSTYRWDGNATPAAWVKVTDYNANIPVVNLMPSVYWWEVAYESPRIYQGLTYTVNNDGSVGVTGTCDANNNSYYIIAADNLTSAIPALKLDPTKSYMLSGCPSGGSDDTYNLRVRAYPYRDATVPSGAANGLLIADYGSGAVIPAGYEYVYIYIWFKKGYACKDGNNQPITVTFKPMIEVGETKHSFVSSRSGASLALTEINNLTIGGKNILRGTGAITKIYPGNEAIWKNGKWYKSGTGTVTAGVVLDDPPVPEISVGVQLKVTAATLTASSKIIGIAQGAVPILAKECTLSVWAKGTAGDQVRLQSIYSNGTRPETSSSKTFTIANEDDGKWQRYSYTFTPAYDHPAGDSNTLTNTTWANMGYVYFISTEENHTCLICGIQLEYGNRITDWTPAPEDIETSTNDGSNLLRGTGDINVINGSTYGLWKYGKWFKGGTGTTIAGVAINDSPVPAITSAVQLIVTSETQLSSSKQVGIAQGAVPIQRKELTHSVWVKGETGDTVVLRPLWTGGSASITEDGMKEFTIPDGNWNRYTFTKIPNGTHSGTEKAATSSGTGDYVNAGYVYLKSATVGHSCLVCGNKMEYGNKATDWTPAIEDLQASESGSVNIIPGTAEMVTSTYTETGSSETKYAAKWTLDTGVTVANGVATIASRTTSNTKRVIGISLKYLKDYIGKQITISADIRASTSDSSYTRFELRATTTTTTHDIVKYQMGGEIRPVGGTWKRYSQTFTCTEEMFAGGTGSGTIDLLTNGLAAVVANIGTEQIEVRHIKCEVGPLASDWSEAPEDLDNDFRAVYSRVDQLDDSWGVTLNERLGTKEDLSKYMFFTLNGLVFGAVVNGEQEQLQVVINNKGMFFYNTEDDMREESNWDQNKAVAYIVSDKLYINESQLLSGMTVGRYKIQDDGNNGFAITY